MVIPSIKYKFDRMMGKTAKLDPRQSLPRNLQIGPLSFDRWDDIMEGIFKACQTRSLIVIAYKIKTLDDFLTFDRQKAIARGLPADCSNVPVSEETLPNIGKRWSAITELWPMLTRRAARDLGIENGPQWEPLSKFSLFFLSLRTLEAKNNLNEALHPQEIEYLNQACQAFGLDFTFST